MPHRPHQEMTQIKLSNCQPASTKIDIYGQSESKTKTLNPQVGILITGVVAGPTVRSFPFCFNLLHSFPQVNNHFFHLFLRLGWTVHCGDVPPLCGFSGSAHWSVFACFDISFVYLFVSFVMVSVCSIVLSPHIIVTRSC